MKLFFALAFAMPVLICTPVAASDVWLLEGGAGACRQLTWSADALFLNASNDAATVRLLGISNTSDVVLGRSFTLPPNQVTSMTRTLGLAWGPSNGASPYFVHVDVPDSVVVRNVLNVGTQECTLAPVPDNSALYGTADLPLFRSLQPADQTRYILGADLGLIDSRTNVGIYNAGDVAAVADVQLLRGCDGEVVDRATFAIAPNTLTQVTLAAHLNSVCNASHNAVQPWVNTVRVTVNQPSLSYVANVVNGETPRVLLAVQ